jgi:hypothetical protein
MTEPQRSPRDEPKTQPWVYVVAAVIVLGLLGLFVAMHLAGAIPSH